MSRVTATFVLGWLLLFFSLANLLTAAEPPVSGVFKGNGKDAKLAFVSARRGEDFSDKPSLTLIFTEKDHSKDKRPDLNAAFGRFGSALILRVHEDGGLFGCEVAHAAHKKGTFSSIGNLKTSDFKFADGVVSGKLKTDGEVETFGQTWQIDLAFSTKLIGAAAPVVKSEPKPVVKPEPKPKTPPADPKPMKAAATINVYDLPIPADATGLEHKKLVEQLSFASPTDVKTMAAMLQKDLDKQGWKTSTPDLITPKSCIIRRKQGAAELTIFVKPGDKGSTVLMMTEGLDWREKK